MYRLCLPRVCCRRCIWFSKINVISISRDDGGSGVAPRNLFPFQMRWRVAFGWGRNGFAPPFQAIPLVISVYYFDLRRRGSCFHACWWSVGGLLLWFLAHTFHVPDVIQLKHAILRTIGSSMCEFFPHPLHGLTYNGVREILVFWDRCSGCNIWPLDNVNWCMSLKR